MTIAVSLSLLAALPFAGAARADAGPSYDDSALRRAIPAGVHTIGVTVAGEFDDRAAAARQAVVNSLHGAGYWVRLIGGAPGTVADPPTADVVARLSSIFHLDLVVVVQEPGADLSVELRDRTGALVGRATMVPGSRAPEIAPPETPRASADPQVRALGEELYAREEVELVGRAAYQGRGRRPLQGADFYATVGRADLAEQYRSRDQAKGVARGIGGAAVGVGVVWGLLDFMASAFDATFSALPCLATAGSSSHGEMPDHDWCQPHQPSGLPWAMAGLGLGMLIIPSAVPSDPVPDSERRQLVDRYNDDLRARAGLPRPQAGDRRELHLELRVAPVVTPEGGGMVLSGSF